MRRVRIRTAVLFFATLLRWPIQPPIVGRSDLAREFVDWFMSETPLVGASAIPVARRGQNDEAFFLKLFESTLRGGFPDAQNFGGVVHREDYFTVVGSLKPAMQFKEHFDRSAREGPPCR